MRFRVWDGDDWHEPTIRTRLVFNPNGTWTLRRYPRAEKGPQGNDVIEWAGGGEKIAWSAHPDHKIEWTDA